MIELAVICGLLVMLNAWQVVDRRSERREVAAERRDLLRRIQSPQVAAAMLNRPDLIKVVGNITKPTWASDIAGHSDGKSGMPWRQGFTSFVDAVVYPVNIGARRRNTMFAATALT